MSFVYIILISVLTTLQSVFQKEYNSRAKPVKIFLFLTFTSFAAFVFYLVGAGFRPVFEAGVLPYSIGFAVTFSAAFIGQIFALRNGSMALTTLVLSYSLLIPTFFGMIFLKEPISVTTVIGIALLCVSVFLLNMKKKGAPKEAISIKWVIFAVIAFIGNGFCSTVQKLEQIRFDGGYKNEFMMLAMLFSAVCMFIFCIGQKELKRDGTSCTYGLCAILGICNGLANAGVNMLVMVLSAIIPLSLLFPGVSAFGLIFSFLFAVLLYKERFSKLQLIAYAISVFSIVFLNV